MKKATSRGSRTDRSKVMTVTISETDRKKLRTAAYRCDTTVPQIIHLLIRNLDNQWIRQHKATIETGK